METINFQMLASLANAARRCDIDLNSVMQELKLEIDMSGDPRLRRRQATLRVSQGDQGRAGHPGAADGG